MADITGQDLRALLEAQRAAFTAEMPVSLAVRKDRMQRAINLLVENSEALCAALSDDFGHRSREQSMLADIVAPIRTFKHAIKHVDRWARNEKRKLDFPLGLLGAKAWVEYQPKRRGRRDRAVELSHLAHHGTNRGRVRRGQSRDGEILRIHPPRRCLA
jgi:acyl-CoA reductase-like NAD-dependent aldehyde dehydrogenase